MNKEKAKPMKADTYYELWAECPYCGATEQVERHRAGIVREEDCTHCNETYTYKSPSW